MSLYVVLESSKSNGSAAEFHVPFKSRLPDLSNEKIKLIQADGHELEFILAYFKNIPYTSGRVQKWFGEMANYMYQNLR